jgi:transposase-like protein
MELKMTLKEVDRYSIVKAVKSKKINLRQASKELRLSYRQMLRIWINYSREGPKGLISQKRGKPSNNQIPYKKKYKVLFLIRKKYIDYGPTLVKEKLEEKHNIKIGKETLRQLMIAEGIWEPKKVKKKKIYARRTRRSRFGELIQIDGSYHYWFEDRGEKCCLLVAVDDATSALTGLRFCNHETTNDYLEFLKEYVKSHGKPKAFYSDKLGVFRVNNKKRIDGISFTQFQRVLKELDIELICAHSPQAKGRVERANGTLQDRLIKELRERNISSIEETNEFLETFIIKYNKKFAKEPASKENAHREMLPSQNLEEICLVKEERVLTKDLSFQYKREIYQVDSEYANRLYGKKVQIYELKGEIKRVMQNGKKLKYKKYREKISEPTKITDIKELEVLWPSYGREPKKHHPWR